MRRVFLALLLLLSAATASAQGPAYWGHPPGQADITRIPGRLFIGPAADNDGLRFPSGGGIISPSGFTDLDWLGRLSRTSINGGDGVGVWMGSDANYSQALILANPESLPCTLGAPCIGLTVGVQTLNSKSGASPRALNIYGVKNNDASQFVPVWAGYAEGHRLVAGPGNVYAWEMESRNSVDLVIWNPYSTPGTGTVTLALGTGSGLSPIGQYPSTAAIYVTRNPVEHASGIIFLDESIGPHGPGGSHPAVQLPAPYEIQWWKDGASVAASLRSDAWGNLYLGATGDVVAPGNMALGDGAWLRFGQNGNTYIGGSTALGIVAIGTANTERWRAKRSGAIRYVPLPGPPVEDVEAGDTYFDAGVLKLRTWDGTAWRDHW